MTGLPHFAPKAKRIIYLFQNGAPSQLDLFDYKPLLQKMQGEDLPASVRNGPASYRHDGRSDKISPGRYDLNLINTGSHGHGSANCCPIRQRLWMIFVLLKACIRKPSTMIRRLPFFKPARSRATARAWAPG